MSKQYRLSKSDIAPLALGRGGCLATDRIVVDGCHVGYMYREKPNNKLDSGWRFFSGDEDKKYMSDNKNHDVYDVNTLVNYDPAILPYLDAEFGSRFERDGENRFRAIPKDE